MNNAAQQTMAINQDTALQEETLPLCRPTELAEAAGGRRWLIESMWAEEGVGLIGGSPKSCKSWLGLEMATSVASGTPCLGRFAVHNPGPALVFLAEDAQHVVRDRLQALANHHHLDLDALDLHVITSPTLRLDLEQDQVRLHNTLASKRPRMLLLDPFVRLHRIDENSATEVAKILDFIRRLQREHHTAIVLVHHTRKSGARQQAGQALRGSGDFHAFGDSNLYLTHQRARLKLTFEHRAAEAIDPIHLRLVTEPLHLALADAPIPGPTLEEQVIAELNRVETPVSRTSLRERLRVQNKRLGLALEALLNAQKIRRTPQGWTI